MDCILREMFRTRTGGMKKKIAIGELHFLRLISGNKKMTSS